MEIPAKSKLPVRWIHDWLSPGHYVAVAIEDILFHGRSRYQTIDIIQTVTYGRALMLDNEFQSAEADEFFYHESLVHPAMLLHPAPRKVCIIGGAEGSTLREVLRHDTVEEAWLVELDEMALNVCRQYLECMHRGAFEDPRTRITISDGRRYLEETPERFDAIFVDITNPVEDSPSYLLFTQEFYQLAKGRLTERGVFCVQAGCAAHTQNGTFAKVYNTLRQVFPHCFAYKVFVPFYSTEWGFVVCTVSEPGFAPVDVLPHEINHRLQYRHADGLKFYSGESHRMLFTLPPVIKRRLEREIHVIRDREPLREKFPGRTK